MNNLKAWLALQTAKGMMWLIRLGIGWVKSVTPEYAMTARRSSKSKIIFQKAKALATPGEADDIAPLGAYVYMGFETMKQAQKRLMDIYEIAQVASGNEPSTGQMARVLKVVRETIHILDEQE